MINLHAIKPRLLVILLVQLAKFTSKTISKIPYGCHRGNPWGGKARQPEADSSGPEVDRAQAGAPGTALIHTGLGCYETIVRLT